MSIGSDTFLKIDSNKKNLSRSRRRIYDRLPTDEEVEVLRREMEEFEAMERAAEEVEVLKSEVIETDAHESSAVEDVDTGKRSFLKMASIAGLGAVALGMLPKKAEAYVMGSSPTSGVVGVKNASDTRVNPATEETVQGLLTGQSVSKMTVTLTSSGIIRTPSSGKRIRVYANRFSLSADMSNVSFRFTSGGTDYEKYVSPKTGGLYGANNHPNFVQGGVDEVVYCVINGTGTVQINLDYLEV